MDETLKTILKAFFIPLAQKIIIPSLHPKQPKT
jgi:hypothetical protein